MKVLVDTSVWTLAIRRRRTVLGPDERAIVMELTEFVRDDRVLLIGPVRQELLTGIRSDTEFECIRERLSEFDDEPLESSDFVEAARCSNRCRAAGIAGSPTDLLLCAVAIRRGISLFTTDADFTRFASHLPLALHAIPGH